MPNIALKNLNKKTPSIWRKIGNGLFVAGSSAAVLSFVADSKILGTICFVAAFVGKFICELTSTTDEVTDIDTGEVTPAPATIEQTTNDNEKNTNNNDAISDDANK